MIFILIFLINKSIETFLIIFLIPAKTNIKIEKHIRPSGKATWQVSKETCKLKDNINPAELIHSAQVPT
jgi:hypothetical protein